jgi:hypothetical protein
MNIENRKLSVYAIVANTIQSDLIIEFLREAAEAAALDFYARVERELPEMLKLGLYVTSDGEVVAGHDRSRDPVVVPIRPTPPIESF